MRYKQTPKATLPISGEQGFPEVKETDLAEVGQMLLEAVKAYGDDHIRSASGPLAIYGGEYVLTGGLSLRINKPLRVYDRAGVMWQDFDPTPEAITLNAADAGDPRIDLIYLRLATDADANSRLRHFKLDPTDDASEEDDINVAEEKRNTVTIGVVTGVPAAQALVPDVPNPATDLPLLEITVPASATALAKENISDRRYSFHNLEELSGLVDGLVDIINEILQNKHRHPADQVDIGPGAGKFSGLTDQQAWNLLGAITDDDENQDDPIVRPETLTPEIAPFTPGIGSNVGSGKLGSVGVLDGGVQAVDIPVNRRVVFGSLTRVIEPGAFPTTVEGTNVNARIVNKDAGAGSNSSAHSVDLSLASVSVVESDGAGDYTLQLAGGGAVTRSFYGGRSCAARDTRYIEVFGGTYINPGSAWRTYDSVAKTMTTRAFTGDIPAHSIIFAAPIGDGANILLAERGGADNSDSGTTLRWYKLNAVTGACTRIVGAPDGVTGSGTPTFQPGVVGDLVQSNVIIMAIACTFTVGNGAQVLRHYVYHSDTNTFEQFTPSGIGITATDQLAPLKGYDACFYKAGQLVVQQQPNLRTVVFDYPTRSYTALAISQPTPVPAVPNATTPLTLVNSLGRVHAMGEFFPLWSLTPASVPQWTSLSSSIATDLGTRGQAGMASLLDGGLPRGRAYVFGGVRIQTGVARAIQQDVWQFEQGGVVQTTIGGITGLTLGPGTNEASVVIDDGFQLPWKVAHEILNLLGDIPTGSVKLYVQFDADGWVEVVRDKVNSVTSSGNNPVRKVKITMYGTAASKPFLTKLNELYEQDGQPGLTQTVIRYNVPTGGVRYVYLSREGAITIETTFQATTPGKALLTEVTPGVGVAPTPLDYVNKRWDGRKYTGTRASGATPSIPKEWSVKPTLIRAFKIVGGAYQKLAAPAFTLNAAIPVAGLASDGDEYEVEMLG